MNKKEETLLNSFPKHQDNLKEQLKNDNEYAGGSQDMVRQ